MNYAQPVDQSLLRRTVVEVASLTDDDLAILLEIVAFLKQQKSSETVADIRRSARQRAAALRDTQRSQLAAQLREVGEKIRGQVIANGMAVEGDWKGD